MSGDTAPGGKTPSRPSSILFMCGMNAIRSPMAEALARAMLPQTVYVASAGVRAGERDPFVDAVLEEEGLTLGHREPQTLRERLAGKLDVDFDTARRLFTLVCVLHWRG